MVVPDSEMQFILEVAKSLNLMYLFLNFAVKVHSYNDQKKFGEQCNLTQVDVQQTIILFYFTGLPL